MPMRWWLTASLALALAGLAGCNGAGEKKAGAEQHAEGEKEGDGEAHVTVKVVPARKGAVIVTVEGLGRCEALPEKLATLTPAVEGHAHELLVRQGEEVKKGQPIVELDKAVAEADLAEKSATRDGLKASLALLKSIPRPEERRANELAVEQGKVAVALAKANLEHLRPLRERREIPEQQLFTAEKALDQARLQQETAEAQLKVMLIGPRPEAVAEAEGKIKTADAAVAFSKAHLDFHTIRSPIDGVLDSLTCHPGQTIAIGANIGEVVDTGQVFATLWLPPRAALAVHVGQTAAIESAEPKAPKAEEAEEKKDEEKAKEDKGHEGKEDKAKEDKAKEDKAHEEKTKEEKGHEEGGKEEAKEEGHEEHEEALEGKVAFVGRVADPQTGNLPIRVLIENHEGKLTVGQSVRVRITVDERPAALQVPAVAVYELEEGPVLNVVREGKAVALHPELGVVHDGWAEVLKTDLKPGEPVIVEGGYNLPADTPVKVGGEEEEKGNEDKAHEGKAGEKAEDAKGHEDKAKEKGEDAKGAEHAEKGR
jgi:multidrug efflux pump subunit AcrA (membrane-fusion protein)